MKCAKVISVCLIPKKKIDRTYLLGEPVGFFGHSQKSDNVKDTINNLEFLVNYENKYNPGVERDLIIVNNNIDNFEGNTFLKKFLKKINNGKIICLNRDNIEEVSEPSVMLSVNLDQNMIIIYFRKMIF